jgi:hypothetical protein
MLIEHYSASSQQQLSVYRNNAAGVTGNSTQPTSVRGGTLSGSTTSSSNSTNTTSGGGSSTSSKAAGTGDATKQAAGWVVVLFAAVFASVASL